LTTPPTGHANEGAAQSLKGGTTAVTAEKAFLFSQLIGGDSAILVGDLLKLVDVIAVHIGRQDVLTNALGDVRIDLLLFEPSGLMVLLEDRAIGVHPPDLDVRILFFQVFRRSTDGTSRLELTVSLRPWLVITEKPSQCLLRS
jgi:hypothetical protein